MSESGKEELAVQLGEVHAQVMHEFKEAVERFWERVGTAFALSDVLLKKITKDPLEAQEYLKALGEKSAGTLKQDLKGKANFSEDLRFEKAHFIGRICRHGTKTSDHYYVTVPKKIIDKNGIQRGDQAVFEMIILKDDVKGAERVKAGTENSLVEPLKEEFEKK